MKSTLWIAFVCVEGALWTAFMTGDILNAFDTTGLKYASILLIMILGLFFAVEWRGRLVAAALVFTAAADLFLLVLDQFYAAGILLFCVVQSLYAVRIGGTRQLFVRLPVPIILCLLLLKPYGVVVGLAAGYILFFALNMIEAGRLAARFSDKTHRMFFTGLALYFVCDICVGLSHLAVGALQEISNIGMWAFYLPGQVLILASAVRREEI